MTQVGDAVTSNDYGTADLKSQSGNNYGYDLIGNMVSDVQGGISNITWTIYGKIKKITKSDGSTLEYKYDADGNRVSKVYTHAGQVDKTWYVRDASGNVLAIYGNKDGDGNVYWKEQQLYGSSRLGSWYPELNIAAGAGGVRELWGSTNKKQYELTNHLGNVLATVSDELKSDNTALVMSANDYYPFGMIQPDRSYSSGRYRYGFNGQEKSDEVSGEDNSYTALFWEYNPRIGRRWNIDPRGTVGISGYNCFDGNPISICDPFGDKGTDWIGKKNKDGKTYMPVWDETVHSKADVKGDDYYIGNDAVIVANDGNKYHLMSNGKASLYIPETEVKIGRNSNLAPYTSLGPESQYKKGNDLEGPAGANTPGAVFGEKEKKSGYFW